MKSFIAGVIYFHTVNHNPSTCQLPGVVAIDFAQVPECKRTAVGGHLEVRIIMKQNVVRTGNLQIKLYHCPGTISSLTLLCSNQQS